MSFNLSEREVSEINLKHLRAIDKLYRMHTGVGSELLSVKNDTMVLEINVNALWLAKKTLVQTSDQFLNDWKEYNKELQKCKYYIVYIYESNPLGFTIDIKTTKEEIALKLNEFNSRESKILLDIFSNY